MSNKRLYYWLLAAIILIVFLVIFYTQQPPNQNDDTQPPTTSITLSATSSPTDELPTTVAGVEEVFCKRPYQNSSIWNTPIDWSIAKIHPDSDVMMAAFFENTDWIGSDTSQF